MPIVNPLTGVDGLSPPFASIARAALEGGDIVLQGTSPQYPYAADQRTEKDSGVVLDGVTLTANTQQYVQEQPLADNMPVTLAHPCEDLAEFYDVYGSTLQSNSGAVGGSYISIDSRIKVITNVAAGQEFRIIAIGRSSLSNGLKFNIRQQGRNYLDVSTGVWDQDNANTQSMGFPPGSSWDSYTSDWFTMNPSSGSLKGTAPYINSTIELQLWNSGAGTADVSYFAIQKRGVWSSFAGGTADTFKFPIGSRTDGQYGVSGLYTSANPVLKLSDLNVPTEGTYTSLAEGEWAYVHNTLSEDGGHIYYRTVGGASINSVWFIPTYGSRSGAVISCRGEGSISNITTYGGTIRGIAAEGLGTNFTGSNINSYLAHAAAICAMDDADFNVSVAEVSTAPTHSKGFMGDRGGNLAIHRGNTLECYDNSYQAFSDNTHTRKSGLFMTSCRVEGEYDLETGNNSGYAVNGESFGAGAVGYDITMDHCLILNISATASGNPLSLKRTDGVCSVNISNSIFINNSGVATSTEHSGIAITGHNNRWGGTGTYQNTVGTLFSNTGENLPSIADQFVESNPLGPLIENSVLAGLAGEALFTDFNGNTFKDNSAIGAYSAIPHWIDIIDKRVKVTDDKGTQLMDKLLLNQYGNSINLKEYIGAYVSEMDLLFKQIEEVYLGRFIEYAEGTQLDTIGIILNEGRSVPLPISFFGFNDENIGSDTQNVVNLANEQTPSDGGVFKSEGQIGTSNFALSDEVYRRLLLAKAYLSNQDVCSVNVMYHAISTLLGHVPTQIKLSVVGTRQVLLELSSSDTSPADDALITYFGKYLVSLGTTFNVTRI